MQENRSGDFEVVDKMATVPDPSAPSSSVLTNVAPPSALPSFLTSPLPSATPATSVPPESFSQSSSIAPSPGKSVPLPPSTSVSHPHGPSIPPFTSPSTPTTNSSIPAPRSPSVPPSGSSAVSHPEMAFPYSANPGVGISPPGTGPSSSTFVPSEVSPYPAPPLPPMSLQSPSAEPTMESQPQPPDMTSAVTCQPQPPNRQKTHSRHHSYPLYVPGNPLHCPPPPPTPPCLVVQQEQANISLSKSQSHIDTYAVMHPSAEVSFYCSDPYASGSSYDCAYFPSSAGNADATASVDLGSPGVVASAKKEEGRGWFGWIRGTVSNVGHRVAERAKTSMDSMITTLDPQMKEFLHSGGDMDIIVASDKEVKVGAIREAFQMSFGKATVCGMKTEAQGIAAQPVGFEAALSAAEGRINYLRSTGRIHPQHPIVAVENFIVELQSDCWFDIGLLLLDDPGEDILLQTYTQVTPVPPDFVNQARTATPEDYPLKESGFAITIGQIASQNLQVHHSMWQEALTGVSRREALLLAGRTLAGLYRSRLPTYH
ncbi:protein PRRC1-like isoform X1 [Portunus trituberculatus]|uniref:protein PRRC1-like isoform X1 n=1 Tax=Portunus trituberculatus TaxID=210409 RepID=UPI001E1CB674|nr:protein PRRC1-like isoform X1 [Portunus trituberculatus]